MTHNLTCDPYATAYNFKDIHALYHPLTHKITCGDKGLIDFWDTCRKGGPIDESSLNGNVYGQQLLENGFLHTEENCLKNRLSSEMETWHNSDLEIYQLYLIVNRRCNFKCKYCRQVVEKSSRNANVMSREIAFETVQKFLEQPTKSRKGIVFYGGEPALSFPLIKELISFIRSYRDSSTNGDEVEINIFTNGTMITAEMAEFLAQMNTFIIVSFDGLPEQNDTMRVFANGKGTSSNIIDGIKTYQKAGCQVGVSLTIGAHNIDKIKEAVDYIKSLEAVNLGFNLPHDDEENPLRPSSDNDDWLEGIMNFFWEETAGGLYAEHIIRKLRLFVNKRVKICECPAANGRIVVLPDGSIGPCEGAIGYDNFFLDPSCSWNKMEDVVTDWKGKIPLMDTRCQRCPSLGICGGGCMLDGYFEDGALSNYNTIRCQFAQKMTNKMLQEIISINQPPESKCWNITDEDRNNLWEKMVHNHVTKPLTTTASFGEICLG